MGYLASSYATLDLKSKSLFPDPGSSRESALSTDTNYVGLLFQVPPYEEQEPLCVTKIGVRKVFVAAHLISISVKKGIYESV